MSSTKKKTVSDYWDDIFNKYNFEALLQDHDTLKITAEQIKEFKEPRLMTKFDTSESLPSIFKKHNLGILPDTRGSYIIGKFNLYEKFPERLDSDKRIEYINFPDFYETLSIDAISSEANALNAMSIAGLLDIFLNEDDMVATTSGRMGSGQFSFFVGPDNKKINIDVNNSQIEIDGGYENHNTICLIEAKNVIHSDFLIRQLYYPYRMWESKVTKPIRPVFVVYSNSIFRMLEYEFKDKRDYNSISLVKESFYSFENPAISLEDIKNTLKEAKDVAEPNGVPFPQANDFDKVISLLEQVKDSPLTTTEIAANFGFDVRQSDYYFNAANYLGLVEKVKDEESKTVIILTPSASKFFDHKYRTRQLLFVDLILQHKVFKEVTKKALEIGEIPDFDFIEKMMTKYTNCQNSTLHRRASTVMGWVRWILKLINE